MRREQGFRLTERRVGVGENVDCTVLTDAEYHFIRKFSHQRLRPAFYEIPHQVSDQKLIGRGCKVEMC